VTTSALARSAYASGSSPVRTPRSTEYEVFAIITRELRSAAKGQDGGFGALANAIHRNRQLWSLLAADVSSPENRLPAELRARIFYLAEFVSHHSRKVLRNEDTPDPLIEINTAMMRGLRQTGDER